MVKQIKGENMHKRNHKEAVYALKTTFNATSNNSRFIFVYMFIPEGQKCSYIIQYINCVFLSLLLHCNVFLAFTSSKNFFMKDCSKLHRSTFNIADKLCISITKRQVWKGQTQVGCRPCWDSEIMKCLFVRLFLISWLKETAWLGSFHLQKH